MQSRKFTFFIVILLAVFVLVGCAPAAMATSEALRRATAQAFDACCFGCFRPSRACCSSGNRRRCLSNRPGYDH